MSPCRQHTHRRLEVEDFFQGYWERKPLVIRRHTSDYFMGWYGKQQIEDWIRQAKPHYGRDVDMTIYQDGERRTLNKEGVLPEREAWKMFSQGCSLRVLRPQEHAESMWLMLELLEEFFGCGCGK